MNSRLYSMMRWQQSFCHLRHFSYFGRFCKNDDSTTCDKSVDVALENAFKLYNLEEDPADTTCLKKSEALLYYRQMQIIRRMETSCAALYRAKEIRGFCHLYVGQEACAVGMKAAMRPVDTAITSYRSHGWTFLMGVSPHGIIAELLQKQSGCSRGKGGSMHTYAKNFFGGNGIVGAQVPLGAGLAFAHAYRCDGGVCFTIYGDGAANQGQLFEAFNMSCLWQLPIVFVCENNMYGMGTSAQRSSCCANYYTRGDYIPGIWVDGMNVLAVRNASQFVINYAMTNGPIVLECQTYRYHGHSMSDPGASYRKREEIEEVRKTKDPINTFKNICLQCKLVTEDEFKKIDDEVKLEIDEAVQQAKSDPYPDPSELSADIYMMSLEKRMRSALYYNLEHKNIGTPFIPLGTPKATPKSEIAEVTVLPKPTDQGDKDNKKDAKYTDQGDKDNKKDAKSTDQSNKDNKKNAQGKEKPEKSDPSSAKTNAPKDPKDPPKK